MTAMTKADFRRIAEKLIEDIVSVPDDIWEATLPILRVRVGDEWVVVGLDDEGGVAEANCLTFEPPRRG
jgi:hypothetical protein